MSTTAMNTPCCWCGRQNQYDLLDDAPLCSGCSHRADVDTLACDCRACSGRWAIPEREERAAAWMRGQSMANEANLVRAILGDAQTAEALTDRIRQHADMLIMVPRSRADMIRDACEASAAIQLLWARAIALAEELKIPLP